MKIAMTIGVMDPTYIQKTRATGITEEAENRLVVALVEAGFEILDGPVAVPATRGKE